MGPSENGHGESSHRHRGHEAVHSSGIKVERVRRSLGLAPNSIKSVDISKAKKIARLCERDGRVKLGISSKIMSDLFTLARTASLKEIEAEVKTRKRHHCCPRQGTADATRIENVGLGSREWRLRG